MRKRLLNTFTIILGLIASLLLVFLYFSTSTDSQQPIHWLLFFIIMVYTSIISIPLTVGEVSLMPMVSLTAIFVLGPIPAAILEFFTDIFLGLARWIFPEKIGWQREKDGMNLVAATAANFTMHMISILAAGAVFYGFGGEIPALNIRDAAVTFGTILTYLGLNYLMAGIYLYLRSQAHAKYLLKQLRQMLTHEIIPMIFAPLAAHIFFDLGIFSFILFSLTLMISAFILRSQTLTHNTLQRRIQELAGLQAVGQTLSASLELEEVLERIYQEVSKLMPVTNFFVALYHPEANEVSFPLAYNHNQKAHWETRAAGKGVSEYILSTRKPLLMEKNVKNTIESLGLTHYGEEAVSWLGVPILAGEKALGVIAVQSYAVAGQIPQYFDFSHQVILSAIAAQASVAIQNARLYEQTDQALSQKLLELNSILDTTSEGVVLLDSSLKILEVNRATCEMLETTPSALIGKSVKEEDTTPHKALVVTKEVRQAIVQQEMASHQEELLLTGKKEIPVMRTTTPVRDETGKINGWLLVYRDLTEEHQLAMFRADLTRMLVHDLRSPIVTIQGGLDMVDILLTDGELETIPEMVSISRKSSQKMLGMINELLNINQLETGVLELQLGQVDLAELCREQALQFYSLLLNTNLQLDLDLEPDLPWITADQTLLKRILHNLLDNAVKFTPDGGKLILSAKISPDDPQKVRMVVCDNGPGIPKRVQKQLFKKHTTYHHPKSRRRGSGLGLYFCKLAVTAHGGDIRVQSEEGKGSCFTIELPVKPVQP